MTRAVRVITEVAAVDRPFDYLLGDSLASADLGDRVRVDFNHRSVRGWIVDEVAPSPDLKAITKWLGYGPAPALLELLRWAGERWCAPWSRFLLFASPKRVVVALPSVPTREALSGSLAAALAEYEPGVWHVAPTTDPIEVVLSAYQASASRPGSLLVLVPNEGWAERLRGRLEQRGLAVAGADQWDRQRAGWPVIVGSRGAALAPTARLAGAVVIDGDDEAYRSSASPTFDATTLVRERCRRDDAPLWVTSVLPSPSLLDGATRRRGDDLVGGWPRVDVVDRRNADPREGVLSRAAVAEVRRALDGDEAVAVAIVLQRLGRGRLLACSSCGELARCATCGQGEEEVDDQLSCADRHERRARFCRACGSTSLRRVRSGVTTLARDVAAQLGVEVTEVTAASRESETHRVVVGTEAIFTRVRRCTTVIFVDFDQYLLAPRASARRAAIVAVAKAGRLVGPRREGRGAVVVQTRRGDDAVTRALVTADFEEILQDEHDTAELLGLAPYGAVAEVSGEGADEFVGHLSSEVRVSGGEGRYEVRAPHVADLTRALREVERPGARLRIAVQ